MLLDDLERRASGIAEEAREVLRPSPGHVMASTPAEALASLRNVSDALRAALHGAVLRDPVRTVEICELLNELTELQADLLARAVDMRFDSLTRIHDALAQLRVMSSVSSLFNEVPKVLCERCNFDRAVVSQVRGSTWVPQAMYIADGPDPARAAATRRYLSTTAMPLGPMLVETELARLGTPGLIHDPANHPRTFKGLIAATQSHSYVAAPIISAGHVIGFLHADTFDSGRTLTSADRGNLWTFAQGFGAILDRAVLDERLSEQREYLRSAIKRAEVLVDTSVAGEVKLGRRHRVSSLDAPPLRPGPAFSPARSQVHSLLTAREREVIELMVQGARNQEIADQLVIAVTTVKSHVKNVRRKLHASTRADAVSRYLRLTMRDQP